MTKSKARTGADFANTHVRENAAIAKITAALKAVADVGPEHWEYESDLTKAPYKISSRDLSDYRVHFAKHVVTTEVQQGDRPKKVWFGNAAAATKYRPEGQKLEGQQK